MGRLSGDPLSFARMALEAWSEVERQRGEVGWPPVSSEVRAYEQAQTATNDDRKRYPVRYDAEGNPRPEATPKQTPPSAGSRVPALPHAGRLADAVSAALWDLRKREALVLRAHYLRPDIPVRHKLAMLQLSRDGYYERLRCGLWWVAGRLSVDHPRY